MTSNIQQQEIRLINSLNPSQWSSKQPSKGFYYVQIQQIILQQLQDPKFSKILKKLNLYTNLGMQRHSKKLIQSKENNNKFQIKNDMKYLLFQRKSQQFLIFYISDQDHQFKSQKTDFEVKDPTQKFSSSKIKQNKDEYQYTQIQYYLYGKVLVTPFVKLSDSNHFVDIQLVRKNTNKLIIKENRGSIRIKIRYYSQNHKLGTLTVLPLKAHVSNNPPAFGQMNAHIILSLGNKTKQTQKSQSKGMVAEWATKGQPQHSVTFDIYSPLQYLKIEMKDMIGLVANKVGDCILDWASPLLSSQNKQSQQKQKQKQQQELKKKQQQKSKQKQKQKQKPIQKSQLNKILKQEQNKQQSNPNPKQQQLINKNIQHKGTFDKQIRVALVFDQNKNKYLNIGQLNIKLVFDINIQKIQPNLLEIKQ